MLATPNRNRISQHILLIALLSMAMSPALHAQQNSPSTATKSAEFDAETDQKIAEIYLQAYKLNREADSYAKEKNWRQAISKAQQAERTLAGIVRDYPLWRQNLIAMRRRIIARSITEYREATQDPTVGVTRDPNAHAGLPANPEQAKQLQHTPRINYDTQNPDVVPGVITDNQQLYNELVRTKDELRRLAEAYKTLRTNYESAEKQRQVSQYNNEMNKERYEELKKNIESERLAGNKVVSSLNEQLLALEEKLRLSEQARQEAEQRADQLHLDLENLKVEHEQVLQERDSLSMENERLKEIIELNSPEKIKSLLDQNISLSTQLEAANKNIEELQAQLMSQSDEQSVLHQQLAIAREEVNQLNQQMAQIYDENRGYRRRISDLNELTQNLEAELDAQSKKPTMDPAMQEENELLRNIISKQKRTIKAQEDARRLLIDTYKKIQNEDPAILEALAKLNDASSMDLTEVENQLIEAVTGIKSEPSQSSQAIREGLEVEALAKGADKAFKAQRFTAAEQLYRTLIDSQPDHLAGLINFSTILLYRNKNEEAITHLDRACRLNPNLALSYFMRATANYRLNQLDKAAQDFMQTLQLDPANANAFFYLANIEGLSGNHELALKHLAAALKLNPQLCDAHYNMARLYIDMGQLADAARAYDRAIHSGAEPDPELEAYLRANNAAESQVGVDLIAESNPQAIAEELELGKQEKLQRAASMKREQIQTLILDKAPISELLPLVTAPLQAAPTPSPAGQGHKLAEENFSTNKIKVKGKSKELRVKNSQEEKPRLRLRGAPLPSATADEKAESTEKTDKNHKKEE